MRDFLQNLVKFATVGALQKILLPTLLLIAGTTRAADAPTLVLSDVNEPPYSTEAGDGFLDLVIAEAFQRNGLKLKVVKVAAERALLNANAGIEDGLTMRIGGLEKTYTNLLRVPEKVVDVSFVPLVRKAKLAKPSWEALTPLSVGHIQGWKIFEQNLKPGTAVTVVDTADQLLSMLARDRIDVALYERWQGLALASKLGMKDIRSEPALVEREMFIYLHRKHADRVEAVASTLRAMKADGSYARLCRQKLAVLAPGAGQCEAK